MAFPQTMVSKALQNVLSRPNNPLRGVKKVANKLIGVKGLIPSPMGGYTQLSKGKAP